MTTQSSSAQALQSQLVITEAFNRFKETVSKEDQREFDRTAIQDVVDAMRSIQDSLRQRRENRNLRKLYPLLQGLEKYSRVIEVLSNGLSPYLPWIWITSDYLGAFDKLIEAYGKIVETLPRFQRFNDAFKNNSVFLAKLALYYADILEFHRRAYKMVRRKYQEAATIDIIEAKQWRESQESKVAQLEEERKNRQRLSVVSWLDLPAQSQYDECERLLRDCLPGSCDWLLQHAKIEAWLRDDTKYPVVWLHGKPGAGKSVICASLLNLLDDRKMPAIFYFCKYQQSDNSSNILKTLVFQLIARNSDLAAVAYTDYVVHNPSPSLKVLRAMLAGSKEKPGLLHGASPCRIVIDGLDESQESEQSFVVEDLLQLVAVNSSSYNCKLLICSRNVPGISRTLHKKMKHCAEISLSSENSGVNYAIQSFIQIGLRDMEDNLSLHIGTDVVETLSQIMTDKANGMFLWVKLVLASLYDVDSMKELHEAITTMPGELPQLYDQILERLLSQRGEKGSDKIIRILAWLAFARRPLRRHEILHGVAITPETPSLETWNVLHNAAVDKCKPFVEELPDGTIALVHFTAQEYLITQCFPQRIEPAVRESLITFACVTTLKDSLSLIDPDVQADSQLLQVLNGFHALLPYSIDFWIDHLLASTVEKHLELYPPMARVLAEFDTLHQQLAQKLKFTTNRILSVEELDSRLRPVAHLPIASLCSAILAFRAQFNPQSAPNGEESEKQAIEHDPTLLTSLSAKFDKLVSRLLSGIALPDVSQEQLKTAMQKSSSNLNARATPELPTPTTPITPINPTTFDPKVSQTKAIGRPRPPTPRMPKRVKANPP
ncbi:hypothetical protein DL769_009929 [Monosporascus sp. CRB-8-3]|nr:hypothetical protein DL769_009929 [Monosporascus sp. CRB-8-3]